MQPGRKTKYPRKLRTVSIHTSSTTSPKFEQIIEKLKEERLGTKAQENFLLKERMYKDLKDLEAQQVDITVNNPEKVVQAYLDAASKGGKPVFIRVKGEVKKYRDVTLDKKSTEIQFIQPTAEEILKHYPEASFVFIEDSAGKPVLFVNGKPFEGLPIPQKGRISKKEKEKKPTRGRQVSLEEAEIIGGKEKLTPQDLEILEFLRKRKKKE